MSDDDILKRLGKLADGLRRAGRPGAFGVMTAEDAADEIEQLRAKVERLEARGITDMQHEIERLRRLIANVPMMYNDFDDGSGGYYVCPFCHGSSNIRGKATDVVHKPICVRALDGEA